MVNTGSRNNRDNDERGLAYLLRIVWRPKRAHIQLTIRGTAIAIGTGAAALALAQVVRILVEAFNAQ